MIENPPDDFGSYPADVQAFCAQRWVSAKHSEGSWSIQQRTYEVNGIVKTDSVVPAADLKGGAALVKIVEQHKADVARSIEKKDGAAAKKGNAKK